MRARYCSTSERAVYVPLCIPACSSAMVSSSRSAVGACVACGERVAVVASWANATRGKPTDAATAPATDVPTNVRRSIAFAVSDTAGELDGIDVEVSVDQDCTSDRRVAT